VFDVTMADASKSQNRELRGLATWGNPNLEQLSSPRRSRLQAVFDAVSPAANKVTESLVEHLTSKRAAEKQVGSFSVDDGKQEASSGSSDLDKSAKSSGVIKVDVPKTSVASSSSSSKSENSHDEIVSVLQTLCAKLDNLNQNQVFLKDELDVLKKKNSKVSFAGSAFSNSRDYDEFSDAESSVGGDTHEFSSKSGLLSRRAKEETVDLALKNMGRDALSFFRNAVDGYAHPDKKPFYYEGLRIANIMNQNIRVAELVPMVDPLLDVLFDLNMILSALIEIHRDYASGLAMLGSLTRHSWINVTPEVMKHFSTNIKLQAQLHTARAHSSGHTMQMGGNGARSGSGGGYRGGRGGRGGRGRGGMAGGSQAPAASGGAGAASQ
jgi:hypothetical protein